MGMSRLNFRTAFIAKSSSSCHIKRGVEDSGVTVRIRVRVQG